MVTNEDVKDCLAILKGAVTIVYPMGLPPHDPIQAEFDDNEDLAGTQVRARRRVVSYFVTISNFVTIS